MSERTPSWTAAERARRFWTAHGRTTDQLTVLHAFAWNPTVTWTADGLCDWYGVRVDRARAIVKELAACRIVEPAARGHRWNADQDFALPESDAATRIVHERWLAAVGTWTR